MSQIAFPTPEPGILARRDDDLSPASPRFCPKGSLITQVDELRAFETDALTAYRRAPLAVALPTSTAEVARVAQILPRRRRLCRAARRRHVAVRRRHSAGGRRRRRPLQDEPHSRDQPRRPLRARRGRRHQSRDFGSGRAPTASSTRPIRPRSSPARSAAISA